MVANLLIQLSLKESSLHSSPERDRRNRQHCEKRQLRHLLILGNFNCHQHLFEVRKYLLSYCFVGFPKSVYVCLPRNASEPIELAPEKKTCFASIHLLRKVSPKPSEFLHLYIL